MPAPRRKAPALEAPSTIAEATALAAAQAADMTAVEQMYADADASIAQIEAARDEFCKPREEAMKDRFRQLSRWWAVAGDAITEGKRKSAEIAGLEMGLRTSTPALKLPTGTKEGTLAEDLFGAWPQFVKVTYKLDKPSCISQIRNRPDEDVTECLTGVGLRVSQREEFYIARARREPAPANPELVDAGEAA